MAHVTDEREGLVEVHLPPIEVALRLTSTRKIGEVAATVCQWGAGRTRRFVFDPSVVSDWKFL